MRFKLICSNDKGSFTLREEELDKAIAAKSEGKPAIFVEGIVLNWNLYSGIVADKERSDELAEAKKYKLEISEPSPFGKLLAEKLQLSPEARTRAQLEAAKQERQAK